MGEGEHDKEIPEQTGGVLPIVLPDSVFVGNQVAQTEHKGLLADVSGAGLEEEVEEVEEVCDGAEDGEEDGVGAQDCDTNEGRIDGEDVEKTGVKGYGNERGNEVDPFPELHERGAGVKNGDGPTEAVPGTPWMTWQGETLPGKEASWLGRQRGVPFPLLTQPGVARQTRTRHLTHPTCRQAGP